MHARVAMKVVITVQTGTSLRALRALLKRGAPSRIHLYFEPQFLMARNGYVVPRFRTMFRNNSVFQPGPEGLY
jgi:hypothetical protein